MLKAREAYLGIQITGMGRNKYPFTFPRINVVEEVLEKAHWFVMNKLWSLQRWDLDVAFTDIGYKMVPFWVQIHGLPREAINPGNAELLLSKMGCVLEVDDMVKTRSLSKQFLRARVVIDVSKPLWYGRWLQ